MKSQGPRSALDNVSHESRAIRVDQDETLEVRVCTMNDLKACALTLARAFVDDDVAFYPLDVPDHGEKIKLQLWPVHLKITEHIVYTHFVGGLLLTIGKNYDGVALWYFLSRHTPLGANE